MQIFPKHPSAPDTYYTGGGWSPACITAVEKRFTDAEMAAEYWAATIDAQLMAPPDLVAITATVRRFAELPHYDENHA